MGARVRPNMFEHSLIPPCPSEFGSAEVPCMLPSIPAIPTALDGVVYVWPMWRNEPDCSRREGRGTRIRQEKVGPT